MCNVEKIVDNEIVETLGEYSECKINRDTYTLLDTSSTNIIIWLEGKYVLKRKKRNINELQKKWYESIFPFLENEGICNIFIKNDRKQYFTYQKHNQYSLMKFCQGKEYSFGNLSYIRSVIDFIKQIQSLKMSSDLVIDDEMLRSMPKQEVFNWYFEREKFEKVYVEKIQTYKLEFDIDVEPIKYVIEKMDGSGLRDCYEELRKTLSHGEMQGQNFVFEETNKCNVLDWDSLSYRPAIYDIAMSAAFLCRKGRGRFILDCNLFESYINSFDINKVERNNLLLFVLAAFLPDINLLEEYYAFNPDKAKWYIEWCRKAIQDINVL